MLVFSYVRFGFGCSVLTHFVAFWLLIMVYTGFFKVF